MSAGLLVVADLGLTSEGRDALVAAGIVPRDALDGDWAVVRTLDELARAAAAGRDLWLSGLEGADEVGDTTVLTLMAAASTTGRRWLPTGLGVRGMAAALACGAAGIVLDAHLWATAESTLPDRHRALVVGARSGLDTVVHGELTDRRRRCLARAPDVAAPQHVAEAAAHAGRPVAEAARAVIEEVLRRRDRSAETQEPLPGELVRSAERAATLFAAGRPVRLAGSEDAGSVGRLTSVGLWEEALAAAEAHPGADPTLIVAPDTSFTRCFASAMCGTIGVARTAPPSAPPSPRTTLVGASLGRPTRVAADPAASALRALERSWETARRPRAERDRDWVIALREHPVVEASVGLDAVTRPTFAAGPVRRVAGAPRRVTTTAEDEGAIAVVGLGCVLPGGLDVASFWRTLVEGRSAIGPIPRERWDEARYHLPGAGADGPVLSSSRLAGTVRGFRFEAARFRIPPRVAPTMDPSQRLALAAAEQAVRAAGLDRGIDRTRAAVILGNSMGGEHAKSLALRVRFRDVLDAVARDEALSGWSVEDLRALEDRVEARIAERLPPIGQDSMAGLLSNVVAGRVAAWLDWMGGNLTVDAACAASLASLTVAVDWLRAGRCDVVLAGGVDTDLSPETYVGFTRTLALSNTGSSPFSTRADGFVMGEGAAVLALQRLADARRDGRRVLAVIRGVGQSSDGRGKGITAPRAEGQALAMERAWAEARRSPYDVGSIEAHGTGTSVGDRTEAQVLVRQFAHAPTPTWLGSVKSVVGHLKGGAGAASLTRAVLTLATGVVPPTLHAGPVDPELGLYDSPLRLPRFPTPLPRPLVAVSAFGFGGTDFHAVLSADDPRETDVTRVWRATSAPTVQPAELAAWEPDATAAEVACFASAADVGERRVCAPEEALDADERLVAVARAGRMGPTLDRATPFLATGERRLGTELFRGSSTRPVVLLFPGQGAPTEGAWAAARRIPAAARVLWRLAERLGDPERLEEAAERGDPEAVHAVIYAVGVAVAAALDLRPAEVIGHSLGGLGAAVAAGAWTDEQLLPAVQARGRALAACEPGAMAAVRLSEAAAQEFAASRGLWVATVNAEDQVVLAGPPEAVAGLGPDAHLLPVARAYHTPMVAAAEASLRDALAALPPPLEASALRSARTGDRVTDPAEDLAAAVVEPVRFAAALKRVMEAHPDALFVDVGPGRTLAGLASRAGADAVAVDDPRGPAVAAAALLAAGHPGLLYALPATLAELVPPTGAAAVQPQTAVPTTVEENEEALGDDVRAEVLRIVSEVTGYPAAFLTDDAELEADLGVDSIRKMQILGALEQRFRFATPEADLTRLVGADLTFLVAHVERLRGTLDERAPAPVVADAAVRVRARVGPVSVDRAPTVRPDLVVPPGLEPLEALGHLPSEPPLAAVLPTDAGGAAAAGWLRCLAREHGAPLRIVHAEDPGAVAAVATGEEADVDGRRAAWTDVAPGCDDPLPDGVIVLATGGLRGILLPCLLALAPHRPRVVLLHRPGSSQADGVAALRAAGVEIHHVAGDVADAGDAARAVEAAREAFGPVQVVIHAAGVLRDMPAARLTVEDVAAVLRPKWDGARALLAATADLPLLRFVTFSSLSAHGGNVGQAAYAAANAAMETLRHPAGRTLHLAFGPWSGVGMASDPTLQRVLEQRGLLPLSPDDGARTFASLLDSRLEGTLQVGGTRASEGPRVLLGPPSSLLSDRATFELRLDPEDPTLRDHQVSGRPLVPAATWLACMLRAVRLLEGSSGAVAVDGFEVSAPVFVDRPRSDVRLVVRHTDHSYEAFIEADSTTVCRASLRIDAPPQRRSPPAPLVGAEPALSLYRPDLLFHGPSWQVLSSVAAGDDGQLAADLVPSPTTAMAVDAVHQVLAAWSGRTAGWLGLPVGAARWIANGGTAVRIETRARLEGRELLADVVALDADGVVVLRGEGVRLRAANGGLDA
ncbi:MAG: SDR family NAD(P)-dependent oxidoreductase [Alphaproteobacteria bacterium]|nr:SDR family NAD(P)-dependent oxidoreductase [Alphaproteobacteria bacterium]